MFQFAKQIVTRSLLLLAIFIELVYFQFFKCFLIFSFKVHMTRNFFISFFERAFKMMKNGVYFIVIALLVAELFKILVYAN